MERIPVTLVCGFLGAGKTTLIRRWLQEAPAGERWAIVMNERGDTTLADVIARQTGPRSADAGAASPETASGPAVRLVDLSDACACCVAEPMLRRELPRLLAGAGIDGKRPDRLIIELSGQALPARVADLLRRDPVLARAYRLAGIVLVVAAPRGRLYVQPDDLAAPVLGAALAVAQRDAADRVWWNRGAAPDAPSLEPALDVLRRVGPFGRDVFVDPAWPPLAAGARPSGAAFPASPARLAGPGPGGGRLDRCWPGDVLLSRRRFADALARARVSAPTTWHLHALLQTERDAYEWRIDVVPRRSGDGPTHGGSASSPTTVPSPLPPPTPSASRLASRVEIVWSADASAAWLADWHRALDTLPEPTD